MMEKTERPGAEAGPSLFSGGNTTEHSATRGRAQRRRKPSVVAIIHHQDRDREIEVYGRDEWCLRQLVAAGSAGCSTLRNPAPRWSCYVARLRAKGVGIETLREPHGGAYPGSHGRYRLTQPVTLFEPAEAAA